jgi:hypothetical protein
VTDQALEFTGTYDEVQRNFDKLGPAVFSPVPNARVYNNANVALANNAEASVTFNTESFDEGDLHSTSSNTNRLTVAVAGLYALGASIRFAANATGYRYAYFRLNGATPIGVAIAQTNSAAVDTVCAPTAIYRLDAGDWVEVRAYQNSGGALNLITSGVESPAFWIHRLSGFTQQVFD